MTISTYMCPSCKKRKKAISKTKKNQIKVKPYCEICRIKKWREWYKKNRDKKIAYFKKYQKDSNYCCEKTLSQRKIRYQKRKTRLKYPLKGQKCARCKAKAEVRHHTTCPVRYDKFLFLCHSCHLKVHREKNPSKNKGKRRFI